MTLFMFNIQTVIILIFFGNIIAVVIIAAYKKKQIFTRPYIEFIVAKLLQGSAWLMLRLRGEAPDIISIYIGNTILFTGFAFEAYILIVMKKSVKTWGYLLASITAAGGIIFWVFADTPNSLVGYASIVVALIFLPVSLKILAEKNTTLLRSLIALLYAFFSLFLVFRSWYGFFSYDEYSLMTPGFIQNLTFLLLFFILVTGSIGFILMIKERDDILLAASEEKYRTLVENANESILIIQDGNIVFSNRRFVEIFGISSDSEHTYKVGDLIHPDDMEYVVSIHNRRVAGEKVPGKYDFRMVGENGVLKWVTVSTSMINWHGESAVLALLTDITERKNLEEEREKIIADLKTANSKVKTLSGLLPICSSCKKIRDDSGYWNQIEVFISEHSEADFSHSLCPDCMKKLYPDLNISRSADR